MNVAMLVHAYYLKDARVRRYAELLAGDGNRVDVICLREAGETPVEECAGVSIHRVNMSRHRGNMFGYVLEYFAAFAYMFVKLNLLFLKGHRFKIIHVHNFPNFLVFAAIIQKTFGARIILDVHDPMPELFCSKYRITQGHALIRFLRFEESLSIKFSDFVIAANHAFRDILLCRGCPAVKVAVVLNTPDAKFYNQCEVECRRQHRGDFKLLYIGTLAERYGLGTLLKSVAAIKKSGKIPRISLTVIPKIKNEGNYAREFLQEAGRLGLDDGLRILEPVSHDKMPEIIRNADLCAYTPMPDVHMDIALSLKIPEIIAVGRPLVASRLTVLLEYFGEGSIFMCEPGNVQDLVAKIMYVYSNPADAYLRVRLAQENLEKFNWTIQSNIYNGVLATLCD